ncbi:MAG: T9SS type A sorting domain-containing protein [Cytophagaceae bacterium]
MSPKITSNSKRLKPLLPVIFSLILLISSISNAQVTKIGEEFTASTSMTWFRSKVAMNEDGDFVVVYSGHRSGGYAIYAQRYSASGEKVGEEIEISYVLYKTQENPNVAIHSDGSFVVVWECENDGLDNRDIYCRLYQSSGTPAGEEFLVNEITRYPQTNPSVDMDGEGIFFICYKSLDQVEGGGMSKMILCQKFSSTGERLIGEKTINTDLSNSVSLPRMKYSEQGNGVVVWESWYTDDDNVSWTNIHARQFDSSLDPVDDEFLVNTNTEDGQSVPSVGINNSGAFVISWNSSDESGSGVFAQRYNSSGEPQGGEFKVNTNTENSSYSDIFVNNDGSIFITWHSHTTGEGISNVFAKLYNHDGAVLQNDFMVNSDSGASEFLPSVSGNGGNSFIVVFQSDVYGNPRVKGQMIGSVAVSNAIASQDKIFVYPNPCSGILNISDSNGGGQAFKAELISATGEVAYRGIAGEELDFSAYREGIYFLKLEKENRVETFKIILQK